MSTDRAVVVTGAGAVSPAGWSVAETWSAVRDGESCVGKLERFSVASVSASAIGCVPGLEHYQGRESLAKRFADAAVGEARMQAGLTADDAVDHVVVANHGERMLVDGRVTLVASARDMADHVASVAGARRSLSLYGACAGGALAIGTAYRLIRDGLADRVVAGGVDCLARDFDFLQFGLLCAMSLRDCPPEEACCPFDGRRDGFVLAEGAGFVVLETAELARRREATPLARLTGFGSRQNAYDIVASPPDAAGPAAAMRAAMSDAGVGFGDVGYINAHGTSTRDNDWCETMAIRKVFGGLADGVPVSASKSVLGHTMAAAGAIEFVLSTQVLAEQVIPPTINLREPDPHCDLDYVPDGPRRANLGVVMTNSFGFGGHSSALVLEGVHGR